MALSIVIILRMAATITSFAILPAPLTYFPQVEEAIWSEFPGPIDLDRPAKFLVFQPRPWQYAAGTVGISSTPKA